LSHFAGDM